MYITCVDILERCIVYKIGIWELQQISGWLLIERITPRSFSSSLHLYCKVSAKTRRRRRRRRENKKSPRCGRKMRRRRLRRGRLDGGTEGRDLGEKEKGEQKV